MCSFNSQDRDVKEILQICISKLFLRIDIYVSLYGLHLQSLHIVHDIIDLWNQTKFQRIEYRSDTTIVISMTIVHIL